jgi:hypothetical protein
MAAEKPNHPEGLPMPLLDTLRSYGHGHYSNHRFFDQGSLFWSLTRLFQAYYRVITVCLNDPSNKNRNVFLEADIEMFVIWLRIVMNDLAYIIRQALPTNVRSLTIPTGPGSPLNKEMSINDLLSFVEKNPEEYPELTELISSYSSWIKDLRKERDQIIHYKGRVQTFSFEEGVGFAVMDPADRYSTYTQMPDGSQKIDTRQVREFVHEQTKALYRFMNEDMKVFLIKYAERNGHQMSKIFTENMSSKMSGVGCDLFAAMRKT